MAEEKQSIQNEHEVRRVRQWLRTAVWRRKRRREKETTCLKVGEEMNKNETEISSNPHSLSTTHSSESYHGDATKDHCNVKIKLEVNSNSTSNTTASENNHTHDNENDKSSIDYHGVGVGDEDEALEQQQIRISCQFCSTLKWQPELAENIDGKINKTQQAVPQNVSTDSIMNGITIMPLPLSEVKIEIDNPEIESFKSAEDVCSFWSNTEGPLENVQVKQEIDEGEQIVSNNSYEYEPPQKKNGITVKSRSITIKTKYGEHLHPVLDKNPIEAEGDIEENVSLTSEKEVVDIPNCTKPILALNEQPGTSQQSADKQVTDVKARNTETSMGSCTAYTKPVKPNLTPEPLGCTDCGKHLSAILDETNDIYKCTSCSKEYRKRCELEAHFMETHHSDIKMKIYRCSVCFAGFCDRESLDKHVLIHKSAMNPRECNVCRVTFTDRAMFQKHLMKLHSSHPCTLCKNIYQSPDELLNHMKTHNTVERPYKCDLCGKAYLFSGHLQSHLKKHSYSADNSVTCQECGKTFSTKKKFNNHWRSHDAAKIHKCTECTRTFSCSSKWKHHVKRHAGEKFYQCYICGKFYSSSDSFKGHLMIHRGEKPYKCSLCGKAFSQSHLLKSHTRMHKGEKPYECAVCGVAYRYRISWKNHMMTKHISKENDDTSTNVSDVSTVNDNDEDLDIDSRKHLKKMDGNISSETSKSTVYEDCFKNYLQTRSNSKENDTPS